MSSQKLIMSDIRVADRPPKHRSRSPLKKFFSVCFNLFNTNLRSIDGQNYSLKTFNLSTIYRILAQNYILFLFVLILFIPTINCEFNSSHNHNNVIKSKDTINYVDSKSIDESNESDEDLWSRLGHVKFFHAFIASLSVIIVSELGDKTFFIAAIMAMRHSRSTVFMAAMSAIFVMNTLAVLLGMATTVIPRFITHYGSIILFALFGLKMLHEGHSMSDDEGKEEYEEVQKSLSKRETVDLEYNMVSTSSEDPETGVIKTISSVSITTRLRRKLMLYVSLVFIETFTMTFLAEWGDRSQISTIILAAREDVLGVTIGALCGHCICTGIAVLGGRIIAQMISVKTVTLIGGVVFIFFAIFALLMSE